MASYQRLKKWYFLNTQFLVLLNRAIDLMSGVFTSGPGDWGSTSGQVIPYTQKMVLDAALLNTQHDKVRVKWSNLRNGVVLSTTPRCSSY